MSNASKNMSSRSGSGGSLGSGGTQGDSSFRLLFMNNPQPMRVYDLETLKFLEVDDAAVACYGYSRDEFPGIRITDIRPEADVPRVLEEGEKGLSGLQFAGSWWKVHNVLHTANLGKSIGAGG